MIARAADMAEVVLADGMDAAMNRFHVRRMSAPGARADAVPEMSGSSRRPRPRPPATRPRSREAAARLAGAEAAGTVALARPAWPFALAALSRETGRALLVVAPGDDEARDLADGAGRRARARADRPLAHARGPGGRRGGPVPPPGGPAGAGAARPSGPPDRW